MLRDVNGINHRAKITLVDKKHQQPTKERPVETLKSARRTPPGARDACHAAEAPVPTGAGVVNTDVNSELC